MKAQQDEIERKRILAEEKAKRDRWAVRDDSANYYNMKSITLSSTDTNDQ